MAEKIIVQATYENVFEVRVSFAKDDKTKEICHAINNFWGDAEGRLDDANGCIYSCVTKLISKEIARLQMKSSFYCGERAAMDAFNSGIEGFYPIDGSCGIELEYFDDFELNDFYVDFEVIE